MHVEKKWLAPCGLYCGVCGIRIADRDNNQKFKERLAPVYGLKPEDLHCDGCLGDPERIIGFCKMCHIRDCTRKKGYEGCHQCEDFPCEHITSFPIEVGKRVIMRAIPRRRELGTERWVEEEEKRYHCPACGEKLFRGAKRCRACKEPVDAD